MKKMHTLAVYALMAPVITFCASSAFAQEPSTASDDVQKQQQHTMPVPAQNTKGMMNSDHAKGTHQTYLSSQPADSFRAEELIGSELKSRPDNETIGTIGDLLFDDDGQIVAVIVEVGGFLGLGEKEVAISWDSVEHGLDDSDDGTDLTVSATRDELTNAPEYRNETSMQH